MLESVRGPVGVIEDGPGEDGSEAGEAVSELMAMVAFEPQDVQDTLTEFFDWMAERFESDHWKLTERQQRMMGRPTAMMLNSLWGKLQRLLPDILARWCEQTPGATAFILACGIVVVPKVGKQIGISRERRQSKPRVAEMPKRTPSPRVPEVVRSPMNPDEPIRG